MSHFIAQVNLVVEADSFGEACDSIWQALDETSGIIDWGNVRQGEGFTAPRRCVAPIARNDAQDLTTAFAIAEPSPELERNVTPPDPLIAAAEALRKAAGSFWSECLEPGLSPDIWCIAVEARDTRLGYWEWCAKMIAERALRQEPQS